jgi:uncharacterized protein YndB with AHSA1/START domain
MLKKILVVLGAILAVLVTFVATRPAEFRVMRSASMPAPPAAVYARLADFGSWSGWSPWEKLDPAMKRTASGTPGTVGHAYAWTGNEKAGEGRMTITGLVPEERLEIRLEFLKPWKATNTTIFTIRPEGSGSHVTWVMSGTNGFLMKAAGLVMDMDGMVGKDFEEGLRNLAAVAQQGGAASPPSH